MEYWTAFSAAGLPLRYQQQMRRFNNARVEVKHRGTLPSQPDVEGFRSTVTDFLVETTPELFQIDFDSISLSSLVRSDDVRSALQAAETAAEAGRVSRGPGTSRKGVSSIPAKPPVLRDASPLRPDRRRLRSEVARARAAELEIFSDFTRSFDAVARDGGEPRRGDHDTGLPSRL